MARQSRSAGAVRIGADTRVLVLHGSDDFVRGRHLKALQQSLEAAHGSVDSIPFDGRQCTLAEVLDEVRSYAMLQAFKLVVVDEADAFVQGNRAALERYAETPVDHATLVLVCGRWYPGKIDKVIGKVGAVVRCTPPGKEEAQRWLVDRSRTVHGRTLEDRDAALLVDRIGCDMARLATELDKVMLLVGEGEAVNRELVVAVTGRSNDDKAYAVQDALLEALDAASRGKDAPCGQVLALVHDLVDLAGNSDVALCYFAADLTRKLEKGVALRHARTSADVIRQELKLFGAGGRTFERLLDQLSAAQAARWFDLAVAADADFKSGKGTALRNLERLCVALVAERSASAAASSRR